jgi:NTE family protein
VLRPRVVDLLNRWTAYRQSLRGKGVSPSKEMRRALAEADWNDLFQDNPVHAETHPHAKSIRRRFLPGAEFGITERGLRALPGVVSGQKIKLFFNRLVGADTGEKYIEQLPLPLSIIATDIGTGERVVYRDGSLTKAMRASMSVPGLLDPVTYRGRKLVDGGLVDNIPIGEVRARCQPDVVIAVNVGSPLLDPADVGSLLTVAAQMVNILTEQNVTRSLKTLTPSDIYIKPDLEGISVADFERNGETADRGHAAAEQAAERLRPLSIGARAYAAWRAGIEVQKREPPYIDAVEVAELKRVDPAAVARHLRTPPRGRLDTDTLQTDILRIYGDGYYESVDYQVLTTRERNILRITPVEKPWGPNYLRFGFNLDTVFGEDTCYSVRVANHRTWLNDLGGEWLIGAQVGSESGLVAEFYQPLDPGQQYFLAPTFTYRREKVGVYERNDRIAEYALDKVDLGLYTGTNFGVLGRAQLGWLERYRDSSVRTGLPSLPEAAQWFGGWHFDLSLDQTNRLYFPSQGWRADLEYFDSPADDYSRLAVDLEAAWSPTENVVLTGRLVGAASPRGRLPVFDAASLGGFGNLSGFARDQIIGDQVKFASLRTEYILGRMPLGLGGDIRLGASLEAGRVDGRFTETRLDGWLGAGSVYLGGETPLGPVYLGYGYAPRGRSSVLLFVGTP